jgi:hypothetical protein
MSYDLTLLIKDDTPDAAVTEIQRQIEKSPILSKAEIFLSDIDGRVDADVYPGWFLIADVCLRASDEVRAIYKELLEIAKSTGASIHDPQLGEEIDLDNPGEVPPLFEPLRQKRPGA